MSKPNIYNVIATGTTEPRDIRDRFSDVINVKDFGAKGDGVTDDTEAIQKALEYSVEKSKSGRVVKIVGSGCYGISRQLVVKLDSDSNNQVFTLNSIRVLDNWTDEGAIEAPVGTGMYPAIYVQSLRTQIWFSKLDCRHKCSGVFFYKSDSTLLPKTTIFHQKDYGISWKSGNTMIFNPLIKQWNQTDSEYDDDSKRTAVGFLVDGTDSKVIGADVGGGRCCVTFTKNARNNIFEACHLWDHGQSKPRVDATIVENYSTYYNYMFNCHFDNGHIDMYRDALQIEGGEWNVDKTAATVNHPVVRYYHYTDRDTPYYARIRNVQLSVGFYEKEGTFTGDYNTGLALANDGTNSCITMLNRNVARVVVDDRPFAPYEHIVKPSSGALRVIYLNDKGIKEYYEDKLFRLFSDDGSPGFTIGCGGGITGIGEDPEHPGTLLLYAQKSQCVAISQGGMYPVEDNTFRLGSPIHRYSDLFVASGSINTSDANEKQAIEVYPDDVLDAWGEVEFRQFLFNEAVEKKGAAARIHAGVVAQQVMEVFAKHGLDATRYGLLCYDEWEDFYTSVIVIDSPAVFDDSGKEVEPEKTHREVQLNRAGSRYGIRYSEALCLEAAYQRRKAQRLEESVSALETRIAALEMLMTNAASKYL